MALQEETRIALDRAINRCWTKGRWRASLLVCCLLQPLTASSAAAETLILKDGARIEGVIVSATGTTLAVNVAPGGLRQLRRQDLAQIRLTMKDQTEVQGAFARWSNGVYSLRIGEALVDIRDGEVIGMAPLEDAAGGSEDAGVGGPVAEIEPAAGQAAYVPPPIFVLRGGDTVVGRVQAFQRDSLLLRLATGGERVLRVADIESVALRGQARGPLTEGRFLGWEDGVYSLDVDGQRVEIRDGRPIDKTTAQPGGPVM